MALMLGGVLAILGLHLLHRYAGVEVGPWIR